MKFLAEFSDKNRYIFSKRLIKILLTFIKIIFKIEEYYMALRAYGILLGAKI